MQKKVLVIGGSYFIGYTLVTLLLNEGFQVYVLNRGTHKNVPGAVLLKADRNDKYQVFSSLRTLDVDYIVDISCMTPEQAQIVCQSLCMRNIKKIVFLSSSAVYKVSELVTPFNEKDRLGKNEFWDNYGTNKIKAENIYKKFATNAKCQLIILRPPYVFGERNYAYRENYIFDVLSKQNYIMIPGDGETKIQFIYVYDLACAILKVLCFCNESKVYNVGSKTLSFKNWVESCEAVVKTAVKKIFVPEQELISFGLRPKSIFPFHLYDNVLDTTSFDTSFNQKYSNYKESLENTYKWYLSNQTDIRRKSEYFTNSEIVYESL